MSSFFLSLFLISPSTFLFLFYFFYFNQLIYRHIGIYCHIHALTWPLIYPCLPLFSACSIYLYIFPVFFRIHVSINLLHSYIYLSTLKSTPVDPCFTVAVSTLNLLFFIFLVRITSKFISLQPPCLQPLLPPPFFRYDINHLFVGRKAGDSRAVSARGKVAFLSSFLRVLFIFWSEISFSLSSTFSRLSYSIFVSIPLSLVVFISLPSEQYLLFLCYSDSSFFLYQFIS